MMHRSKQTLLFVLAGILLSFSACKTAEDDSQQGSPCDNTFDQSALYAQVADQLIIPGYEALTAQLENVETELNSFFNDPSANQLEEAQTALLSAWETWQAVAQYQFGPADAVFLRSSLNNYPTDPEQIELNVAAGEYDLDAGFNSFARGFPAFDYLLFGTADSPQEIAALIGQASYRQYAEDLLQDIRQRVDQTLTSWKSSYRNDFVENTGTATGSSLSLMINALNEHYEFIKRDKIGVPLGVDNLGFAAPEKVEAFYSGASVALLKAATLATQELYLGRDGTGLDDFLQEINAQKGNESLDELIQSQFTKAVSAIDQLEGRLTELIENDPQTVETAYTEVVKQIVQIKTDMPSVLCVSITYVDNPNDND
jgi:predicted lipoprotein